MLVLDTEVLIVGAEVGDELPDLRQAVQRSSRARLRWKDVSFDQKRANRLGDED